MLASAEPLNDTEPETSPVSEIVRDVSSVDAVEALPITGAVTAAKVTDALVPTDCPMATVGDVPSPGVWVTVTPVPAVKSFT